MSTLLQSILPYSLVRVQCILIDTLFGTSRMAHISDIPFGVSGYYSMHAPVIYYLHHDNPVSPGNDPVKKILPM
jgi:hypothetical protein